MGGAAPLPLREAGPRASNASARTSSQAMLSRRVSLSHLRHGRFDELLEHSEVDVRKPLDVEADLARPVLSKLLQKLLQCSDPTSWARTASPSS